MTPLQKVGMGLLIVLLVADFNGWDAFPDPLGWLLVVLGVRAGRDHLPHSATLLWLGGLALLVSAFRYPPGVTAGLDVGALWLVDLPRIAFEVVLCSSLAATLPDRRVRFTALFWLLVALSLAPPIVAGSGSDALGALAELAFLLAQLALVVFVFGVSRRPETGAPAPPVTVGEA